MSSPVVIDPLSDLLQTALNTTPSGAVGMAITGRVHGDAFGCRVESCKPEEGKLVLELSLNRMKQRKVLDIIFEPQTKSWQMRFEKSTPLPVDSVSFFHRSS